MGKVSREWLPPLVIIESIGKLSQSIFVSVGFFKSSFDFLTAWVRSAFLSLPALSVFVLYILILVFKANPANKEGTGREDKQEYGGRKKNRQEKFTFGHEARRLLLGALVQVFFLASRVVDTEHVSSVVYYPLPVFCSSG